MTVDRIVMSPDYGFKISAPSVPVKTATGTDVWFNSDHISIPLLETFSVYIPPSGATYAFSYLSPYSFIPMNVVLLSDSNPATTAYSSMSYIQAANITRRGQSVTMYYDINPITGSFSYLFYRPYSDRIEVVNYKQGNDVDYWGGYMTVVLYDFILGDE